ncbi:MAG: CopG family transcriptional regulator [Rhodoglobus sp.]
MKTAISVPDETFRRVEARVAALGLSRSQFYATAAEKYLDELERTGLTHDIDDAIERGAVSDSVGEVGRRQLAELTADDEW